MNKIYIFGHQNPDTDAVTSAISLSYLKNKLGLNTEARVLGHITRETNFVLKYFKIEKPKYLNDVKLQLKDVGYLKNVYQNKDASIKQVYEYLNNKEITGTPIVDDENNYIGIVTIKDISKDIINGDINKLDAKYDNIIDALEGKKILKYDDEIKGEILAASYKSTTFLTNIDLKKENILIVGDRHSIIENAVLKGIKLLIITGNGTIKEEHIKIAKKNKVNIIKTNFDSFKTSKMINLSNSVSTIVNEKQESKTFKETDYYDDFMVTARKLRHNNYPILNKNNKCLGLIRVTETSNKNKKEVILVDHQEKEQSVIGLEEANIREIVDHHKIGDIHTNNPINFRNMTVGSTNTIIYFMYKENNIKIPKAIAGIMLAGILSDTLSLQSPTTTILDKEVVKDLEKIASINHKKFALEMFKNGTSLEGIPIEEVIKTDFKTFPIGDEKIAISQVFTLDIDNINKKKEEYLNKLEEIKEKENYKYIILCITDILKNGSYFLYTQEASNILKVIYNIEEEGTFISGVVSRKKQILPELLGDSE